jgi:hypothetical protein
MRPLRRYISQHGAFEDRYIGLFMTGNLRDQPFALLEQHGRFLRALIGIFIAGQYLRCGEDKLVGQVSRRP